MSTDALLARIRDLLPRVHGWCSPEKAARFVEQITLHRPEVCVEIGVFGGSSLLPQAMALQHTGRGVIYGIDPWSTEAALDGMLSKENRNWWESVNLDDIYQHCRSHIEQQRLSNHCVLLRAQAADVVGRFADESIGLIHIDGNHSETRSTEDVALYLPKVKPGGIIFFDDIWWTDGMEDPTTRRATLYLLERCVRIDLVGDCMILQKN